LENTVARADETLRRFVALDPWYDPLQIFGIRIAHQAIQQEEIENESMGMRFPTESR
jgi:hypothetical protein